jgi:hypothetical protein
MALRTVRETPHGRRAMHMKARLLDFGEIEIEGRAYDHDVYIDGGEVRKRNKKRSKQHRDRFGHTPLSADEEIPWGGKQLIVGTGVHGKLPVTPELREEAERRGIELVLLPSKNACDLIAAMRKKDVHAIVHTTC